MALISGNTIIRSIASLHLILAYYFLTSPATIANHNMVVVFSAAVGLPLPDPDAPLSSLSTPSATTALLAAILALFALSDIAASSMREEVSLYFFSSQTPIRLFFSFLVTGWSYSFRPGGIFASRAQSEALAAEGAQEVQSDLARSVGSGVLFSWGFVQVVMWSWVLITLRDERKEVAARDARRKGE